MQACLQGALQLASPAASVSEAEHKSVSLWFVTQVLVIYTTYRSDRRPKSWFGLRPSDFALVSG